MKTLERKKKVRRHAFPVNKRCNLLGRPAVKLYSPVLEQAPAAATVESQRRSDRVGCLQLGEEAAILGLRVAMIYEWAMRIFSCADRCVVCCKPFWRKRTAVTAVAALMPAASCA